MTVDNLGRRGISKPLECQLCLEHESINHLFFECVIAKIMWQIYLNFSGIRIDSYFDLASKWPCDKSHALTNSITAGIPWGIWLMRNILFFITRSGKM